MIHQFRCNPKAYNHYNSLDVNISVKSGDVVFSFTYVALNTSQPHKQK